MSHNVNSGTPNEPGHRYNPRQPRPRVVSDFSRYPRFAPKNPTVASADTPQTPVPSHSHPAIEQSQPTLRTHIPKPAAPRQKRSLVLRRQIVQGATNYRDRQYQQKRRQFAAFVFGSFATAAVMAVLLMGIGIIRNNSHKHTDTPATLGASTSNSSSTPLDENAPSSDDIANYKVAPDMPKLLTIAKLGLSARVVSVGADISGTPLAPKNIYDVGWFTASGKLGDGPATVLIGSIVGPNKPGVFSNLTSLGVGDIIQVVRGDGKTYTYSVVSSQSYDANSLDLTAVKQSAIAGKPGLNLVTANGRFNVRTNQFEKRTVIFTTQQ